MRPTTDVGERLLGTAELLPAPEEGFEGLSRRRERRRRNERLVAGAVALAVVGATLGGSLFVLSRMGEGRVTRPGDGASGTGTAGGWTGRDLTLAPGQYLYVRTTITGVMGWTVGAGDEPVAEHGTAVVDTWWGTDGSGRIDAVRSGSGYGTPEDGSFGPGDFPIESDVSHLSTDPDELERQLLERSAPGGASPQPVDITPGPGQAPETPAMWRAIRRLLEYPNATPELRAALFRVAARLQGVETRSVVEDPGGRPAVLLEIVAEDVRQRLFFDPSSLQLMAAEERYPEAAEGRVFVLESGIVGSTDARPEGDGWLFPPASGRD